MTQPAASLWQPLRLAGFRAVCAAQCASYIAIWMHTVGVQWLLISTDASTATLAAVQTAATLPFFLFALPAGVLADSVDRRRLMLLVQSAAAMLSLFMVVATARGPVGAAVLLAVTVLIGSANAASTVSWQSLIPEMVERRLVPAAATLDGMAFNLGRIAGPAVGGLLLAVLPASWLFGLNAVVFALSVLVFARWAPRRRGRPVRHFASAMRLGVRYVATTRVTRRLVLRVLLWSGPASAVWALLPAVARDNLHLGSVGYGALFSALGVGAVLGGVLLQPVRARLTPSQILLCCSLAYAAGTAVLGYVHNVPVVAVGLTVAGAAWITAIAVCMGLAQVVLPGWVRARGLAVVLLVHQGAQAFGALAWGLLAEAVGVATALGAAAVLLVAAGLSIFPLALHPVDDLDVTPVRSGSGLDTAGEPGRPERSPLLVRIEYRVDAQRLAEFLTAADALGRIRRGLGAARWELLVDQGDSGLVVEMYRVRSWREHVEQETMRWIRSDRDVLDRVHALAAVPPRIQRLQAPGPTRSAANTESCSL